MYDFAFHKPGTLEEAVRLLSGSSDGLLMAGGQTLIPTLKQRLAAPDSVVDLGRIADLKGIRKDGDAIVVGAMATHAEVAASDMVRREIPALADLAEAIGDPQVRNRGTIGGSIANNDPAADYPAALLGLGATVRTNQREIPADEFFTSMFETALEEHEVVTAVSFPVPKRAAYMKFPNPASRYAIVGVFVAETEGGPRVGVTGAAPCAFRAIDMEKALADSWAPDSVAGITVAPDSLNADLHASAEYRAHLVTVMAKRAVAKSVG